MADKTITMMTPTVSLIALGNRARDNGDLAESVNIFRRSLASTPSVAGWVGLGRAFEGLGDHAAARWAYAKALEMDNSHQEANRLFDIVSGRKGSEPRGERAVRFKVEGDAIWHLGNGWRRFTIRGVNLGLGLPGYFPGEFFIRFGTYLDWFRQMQELGVNTVRLYTVNPPCFYEALHEFNRSGGRLFLLQGIWVELPEEHDFSRSEFSEKIRSDIRDAVRVIHGSATLPERPGYASGRYAADVSSYTIGFLYGREWEPCAVDRHNRLKGGGLADFRGNFLSVTSGTPFEKWVAGSCEYIQQFEHEAFGHTHPVSTINWPTLDPLIHPTESTHENEMKWQGVSLTPRECDESEDSESLDLAKIMSLQGGGFFASYHVYPYYPDFMNNEYTGERDPYLAYLEQLKRHHAGQPVVIAEFGVPSSREITHRHPRGWHHGGHDERRQGEINVILMQSIAAAGMSGSILFSWYDEWFKRNWLFFPYEVPAERNPLWFNLQDAEQNYGLLAMYPGYPGKLVTLSGESGEWSSAATLYRKDSGAAAQLPSGHDGSLMLRSLMAQHDEGFFYIRLETGGVIDFKSAHYLIGIDTCDPATGEFALPLDLRLMSPVGLKFMIQLAGRDSSRILVCRSYDKYLNSEREIVRPDVSREGAWVVMMNQTNRRRMSKDGTRFFPAKVSSMSSLRFGSLKPGAENYSSLADFNLSGNVIELRLPWSLLQVSDPSSRQVVWHEGNDKIRETDGIRLVAASYSPVTGGLAARATGNAHNAADLLPAGFGAGDVVTYTWDRWEVPTFHVSRKDGFELYRNALASMPEEGG